MRAWKLIISLLTPSKAELVGNTNVQKEIIYWLNPRVIDVGASQPASQPASRKGFNDFAC